MEAKFKSLSIFEFQARFPEKENCYNYLAKLKWSNGYSCKKCGHKRYCNGVKTHDRQCTRCNYLESPTSGTIFHKVKFSILKAFWIVYYLSTSKKGMSSTELSRKLQLRQKTCWLFRMKVLQAMALDTEIALEGKVEMNGCELGHKRKSVIHSKKRSKNLVIIAIEKKGNGISRINAQHIDKYDKKNIQPFILNNIDHRATIKTNAWSTFQAMSRELPNLKSKKLSENGANLWLTHRVMNSLTSWLRGIHGHAWHLQFYLNEFCYRFNCHLMKEGLFEKLIYRMVQHKPTPYKYIIAYQPT